MRGVRVSLSSGDVFYVADAGLGEVEEFLGHTAAFKRVGTRIVNVAQVAQLSVEQIPQSLGEIPETLKEEAVA